MPNAPALRGRRVLVLLGQLYRRASEACSGSAAFAGSLENRPVGAALRGSRSVIEESASSSRPAGKSSGRNG
jgi:hypothetical protein